MATMTQSRLIFITHEFAPFRGGVATYVEEVAAAIQKSGAEVEVWAPDYGMRNHAEERPCKVERLRAGGSLRPLHLAQWRLALSARLAQCENATVMLASVGAHLAFMMLPLNNGLARARIVSLLYGSEILRFERNPLWRALAPRLFRRVSAFVTISEFSKKLIEQSFLSAFAKQIFIAPCACTSAAALWVAKRGAQDGKLRVLTLARIHPRKGQLDTARALANLPDELRSQVIYQMGGAGDPDYLRKVQQACVQGGIACEHLGAIEPIALADTYAQCDIFAMTSRSLARSVEGFGIAYLDAGFHHKPVIAYRSGGAEEAVLDGESGLLIEEGNLEDLSLGLDCLISDAALRERLGAGGRKWAMQHSWGKAAAVFLKIAGSFHHSTLA